MCDFYVFPCLIALPSTFCIRFDKECVGRSSLPWALNISECPGSRWVLLGMPGMKTWLLFIGSISQGCIWSCQSWGTQLSLLRQRADLLLIFIKVVNFPSLVFLSCEANRLYVEYPLRRFCQGDLEGKVKCHWRDPHTTCCVKGNKVLCLWPWHLMSSASVHDGNRLFS